MTAGSGTDNGNVFAITNYRDATRSQAFTYDALNRLASGWSSASTGAYSWGENYSIDAWGNLQTSPMSGKAHGGSFQLSGNAQNRPTGLAYDAAGNLTSYLSSAYTYDPENRLSRRNGWLKSANSIRSQGHLCESPNVQNEACLAFGKHRPYRPSGSLVFLLFL
jgi:hypothetical protein